MHELLKSKGNKPRKGYIKICKVCAKEFYTPPSLKDRDICSRKCNGISLRNKVTLRCVVCAKEYKTYPSHIKWRGSSTCSYECRDENLSRQRSGEKSQFWKGGIANRNRVIRSSRKFKQWRKSVFARDKNTCQDCGITNVPLDPHHVKPFLQYPDLRFEVSNGRTLCKKCHKIADKNNLKKYPHIKDSKSY